MCGFSLHRRVTRGTFHRLSIQVKLPVGKYWRQTSHWSSPMTVRLLRLSFVLSALLLVGSVVAVQQPEAADDPLPKGAKVRFGVTRPILRTGPAVAMLPGFKNFLAPTMT